MTPWLLSRADDAPNEDVAEAATAHSGTPRKDAGKDAAEDEHPRELMAGDGEAIRDEDVVASSPIRPITPPQSPQPSSPSTSAFRIGLEAVATSTPQRGEGLSGSAKRRVPTKWWVNSYFSH